MNYCNQFIYKIAFFLSFCFVCSCELPTFGKQTEAKSQPALPQSSQKPATKRQPVPAQNSTSSPKAEKVELYKLAVAPFTIGPGVEWTAAALDNKLAAAAKKGSLYFRKIPANTLMESRAQLQELNNIKEALTEPDFLLLNCTVEKTSAKRFEISATLVSADRSNEIAVITAFADESTNTAAELTAELWRKLDQPLQILRERPNLLGQWEEVTLKQRVSVVLDEGVQLVAHPSRYWTEVSDDSWKNLSATGIDDSYKMWGIFTGQWRRGMLEGRFSGSNGYFSPLIVATVLEDRHDRQLHLSFPNGKSLVWRYLPPELDTGHWQSPDGRAFSFILGVNRISGSTSAKPEDNWNRIEAFLQGQELYISLLKGEQIIDRTTGKLIWSLDPSKSAENKIIVDGQGEWKWVPLSY
jgi:hypothetical protein